MVATTEAPAVSADESRTIMRDALVRRATVRLARIDDIRAAVRLSSAGKSQREIAELLHVTQPVVHRLLRDAELLGTEETPEELILRTWVEGASRDALVARLSRWDYTFTVYAPYPSEGSTPGTWDQVVFAYQNGLLSGDEYAQVKSAVNAPAQ